MAVIGSQGGRRGQSGCWSAEMGGGFKKYILIGETRVKVRR